MKYGIWNVGTPDMQGVNALVSCGYKPLTSMVLASTYGIGMALTAIVLFCWQGSIFLLASYLSPLLSGGLMCEISIVGGFLIFASGLSILKIKEISTMNLLPGLFIPPIWFALVYATGGFGGLI
mgnify:CR=1 FL=1